MKSNSIILFPRFQFFVFAMVFFFMSCSKLEKEVMPEDGSASLEINIVGIKPVKDRIKLNVSPSYGNMIGLEEQNYLRKESSKKGRLKMDIISDQDVLGLEMNQGITADGLVKQSSTSPINGDVKYIFILQRVSDNSFFYIGDYSVNQDRSQINGIETNVDYRWYAYSYLDTVSLAVPTPVISTSIPTFSDKTLVYATGQFKSTGGVNKIPIVFDHKLTQINVEVNVKKAYADITHIKAELVDRPTKVKTGMFDFTTGTISSLTSASIAETDLVFENKTLGDNSVKVAKYYTSDASLTSFQVRISKLTVQYPNGTTEVLDSKIPNGGTLTFTGFQGDNSGQMLQGKLNLNFTLPQVRIVAFSNSNAGNGYRLHTGTGAGDFLRNTKWFGPNSDYVAIDGVSIDPISTANLAGHGSSYVGKLATMLANPANYPEILIVGNWYSYYNEASWNAVRRYLDAGGIVLHTQDENEDNINGAHQADRFMSNLLGQTVNIVRGSVVGKNVYEMQGVYKFTDTPEGAADTDILDGVFGDVRPYHWGQDRYGTMYVVGYTGNDLIVYSNHAQNYAPQAVLGLAFFRHKTKKYFYVGDGGFYLNPSKGDHNTCFDCYPFRSEKTGVNMDFPIITTFGEGAKSNSPMYNAPSGSGLAANYYRTNRRFEIANSMMFGNMMAWMMEQAYFYPVDKTGPIVNP